MILCLMLLLLAEFPAMAQAQSASSPRPAPPMASSETASIGGIVVRLGTNEPVSGADVELSRVEGTSTAPMAAGVSEAFTQVLLGAGPSGPTPPLQLASEVRYTKTASDGTFLFKGLKAGKYRLVAIRIGGGYFPAEYGQHDPRQRGLNFPIAEGQAMKGARLEMTLTGSITGRVLDGDGEPMGHVCVMAIEPQYQEGRRIFTIAQTALTDEHGDYRLFWLAPGHYYVAAKVEDTQKRTIVFDVVPPGRRGPYMRAETPFVTRRILESGEVVDETHVLVYTGGVLTPEQARPVDVQEGNTSGGADIPIGVGAVRSYHLRGSVAGPDGQRASNAAIIALPRQGSPDVMMLQTTADEKGMFDLAGAIPGSYSIYATATTSGTIPPELAAAAERAGIPLSSVIAGGAISGLGYIPIEVANADLNNVAISAISGIQIAGQITIEGTAPGEIAPEIRTVRLNLTRDPDLLGAPSGLMPLPPFAPSTSATSGPRLANGQATANGTVHLSAGIGDYRVSLSGLPANAYAKSIRMGNTDVLIAGLHIDGPAEAPLEIAIGMDSGEISGTVVNPKLESMSNAVIALVPDSSSLRQRPDLYKSATSDANGKFRLQNVPPGHYKLFAWDYAAADSWQDAGFMQAFEDFGKPIVVGERGKSDTQLIVIPLGR